MADISDVEQAVADTVISILYPTGLTQTSIVGVLCRVYRGWPNAGTLNADLNAGAVNVTVVTDNDSGRTTTRYLPEWQVISKLPGAVLQATGQTIIISGDPADGDVVGAMIDGVAFAYRVQPGDTPGLVASNLNHLIQTHRPTSVQGPAIKVPGAGSIKVRVVCDNATAFESRRQEKDLRVICWCPSPPVRDTVAGAIDAAIDQMAFLRVPDTTNARIIYRNTTSYDQAQNALLYRRDLVYNVEYPTISTVQQPSMLFGSSGLNGNITYS